MNDIACRLVAEMEKMPVIDAHEHLPTEEGLVGAAADIFTRILCHYSMTSAAAAGMDWSLYQTLKDASIPLDERWAMFRPYLDPVRDTGYCRAALYSARELCGVDDINDGTYETISERLQAGNTPGLYERLLAHRCRIESLLNQGELTEAAGTSVVHVNREFMNLAWANAETLRETHERCVTEYACDDSDADAFVSGWLGFLRDHRAVGLKFTAQMPETRPSDTAANQLFAKLKGGGLADDEARELGAWLMHRAIAKAPEVAFPIAVHCGLIWNGSGDFRTLDPTNIIPVARRYPDTVFDLYHAGIPWVREIAVMANQFPNVRLNLVWCCQISPYMTEHMLNEWLDLVPTTKIIGFGGDNLTPEKTVGTLKLTREIIARVLSVRVSRGEMSEERAGDICRAWLYENPKRIYAL